MLLAGLLINANRAVASEQIVDWLWGACPPASAVQNLYSYISDLRRQLQDGSSEHSRIETQSGRYRLSVEPGELDAATFEELAGRAVRAADEGDPALAAERFGRALGLWRGDVVLDGLALPESLRTETLRLEELRMTALEGSFAARLELGQHEDVVPEAEDATKRYPLRERIWALLVLALYRSGRKAEALVAYQRAAQVIDEELQTEPGEELRQLYQRIRSGAVAVLSTTTAPTAATAVASAAKPAYPAELPRTSAHFAGRQAELADLTRSSGMVADRSREAVVITAINGMAGVGKTALAVRAAHLLAPEYPDGQIFLDLHGHTEGVPPFEPGKALGSLLRSAGVPAESVPPDLDERAALWRTTLAGRRMLIVLDNAASEAQVRPLLPGTAGCLTMITSRRQLTGLDDAHTVHLGELPLRDAIILFTDAVGGGRITPADRSLVAEVVELCGRLPLAIQLASARLRHRPGWTVSQLADRLRQQQRRLTELEAGERSVAASFRLSYEHLDEEQRRAFRLLGLYPGAGIDVNALAALTGAPVLRAERLLDDLLDANLLQQSTPDRYRFHDLIRACAVQLCAEQEPATEQSAALSRLLDHYVRTTSAAVATVYPYRASLLPRIELPGSVPAFTGSSDASAWLESQLENLLAAAAEASNRDQSVDAVRLASALFWHLRFRGYYSESEPLHAQAVRHARRIGDRQAESEALIALGHAHRGLGRYASATDCFERALALAHELGHSLGERDATDALGNLHALGGRYEAAATCFEHALAIARRIRDRGGELGALLGLGGAHRWRGQPDAAAECYELALTIAREIADLGGVLRSLLGLARIRLGQGAYDHATQLYEAALDTAEASGDRPGELGALRGLGAVQLVVGQPGRALEYFGLVLKRAVEIGDRDYQIEGLLGCGKAKQALGRWAEALADHEEARQAAEELDQPEDRARAHDGIARAQRALGRIDAARGHWERALEILQDLDLPLLSELVDVVEARTFLAEFAG